MSGPDDSDPRWLRLFFLWPLLAVAVLALVFSRVVDLSPEVSPNFFFDRGDPALEETNWINETFPSSGEMLVIAMSAPDIASDAYLERVREISQAVLALPKVSSIQSLSDGPGSLEKARASPLWSRMLIGDAESSTIAIAFHEAGSGAEVVPAVEGIVERLSDADFEIKISGAPFVVEMVARSLVSDMRTFVTTSFAIFAFLMLVLFRSLWVLVGMLVSCLGAVLLTLIVQVTLGGSIGMLTANLATIVTVITLSHIVFLSSNLRVVRRGGVEGPRRLLTETLRRTGRASLWCALTTVLGFGSLLFVDAAPLRDLGLSGSVGTAVALASAYLLYPPFLYRRARSLDGVLDAPSGATPALDRLAGRRLAAPALIGAGLLLVLGLGLFRLETDPSLLDYFEPGLPLRDSLEYVDQSIGSSPFSLVIEDVERRPFEGTEVLERQGHLHVALEEHEEVGTAVSLPLLISEGRRLPIVGRLIPYDWIVDFLGSDSMGNVGKGFVTDDRRFAHILMTLREGDRSRPRFEVVDEIRNTTREFGFDVRALGGLYYLQAHLGSLVRSSLLSGIATLVALFLLVGLAASRSIRTGVAMLAAITLVPVATLGGLGVFRVPVDVISSPASNVCIGMAADAMIHLVLAVRRVSGGERLRWSHWVAARREQAAPILIASGLVIAGFAVFTLSEFPPTVRFGGAVVFGTVVAGFGALVLLPFLACRGPAVDEV